jgi:hypothetical protein
VQLRSDDPRIIELATSRQIEFLSAIEKQGGVRAAARALGVDHATISRSLSRLKRKIAKIYPEEHSWSAPESYRLRGVSTYHKTEDGGVWVKTEADKNARVEILRDALAEIVDETRGRLSPLPPRRGPASDEWLDHLSVYPWADAHIGLHAWAEETKDRDFDLKIADRMYKDIFNRLLVYAPCTEKALLLIIGDYLNHDGKANTTTSGMPQDVDNRWKKVCRVGVCLLQWVIDVLLQKHREVHVIIKEGNHDYNALAMMSVCFKALYEREPRLYISDDPAPVEIFEFGENLIAATHGDPRVVGSSERLPGMLAAKWPEAWGRARTRHVYSGHTHKDQGIDAPGCYVEHVRTSTPPSAWLSFLGLQNGADLKCDLWSPRGRIARNVQGPREIDIE